MDTIRIVMTGLMMLVPPKPGHQGSTDVLMPAPINLPTHVAMLVYFGPYNENCGYYVEGFCIVDMDGWWLNLTTTGGGTPHAATLPRSVTNLTNDSGGWPVAPQYLRPNPGRTVRSRISLDAGQITDSCALAQWTHDPTGPTYFDSIPLANVVTWSIPGYTADSLVLRRTRLDPEPGETTHQFGVARRDTAGPIELFIIHIPFDEAQFMAGDVLRQLVAMGLSSDPRSTAGGVRHGRTLTSAAGMTAVSTSPMTAERHFHAYYDLLRVPKYSTDRVVPEFRREVDTCSLSVTIRGQAVRASVRTYSCVMTSATGN